MKAGAAEFLTKPLDDEILIEAIRDAVLRSQANLKREGAQRQLQERFALLTKREREVMNLVVKGLMNKQVGFELVSVRSPSRHIEARSWKRCTPPPSSTW